MDTSIARFSDSSFFFKLQGLDADGDGDEEMLSVDWSVVAGRGKTRRVNPFAIFAGRD